MLIEQEQQYNYSPRYRSDNLEQRWHYIVVCISRLTIVSREAKKKQAVHDERVSYLQVALL